VPGTKTRTKRWLWLPTVARRVLRFVAVPFRFVSHHFLTVAARVVEVRGYPHLQGCPNPSV